MNVQDYLQEQGVHYHVLSHSETYDAQRMSQALHTSGHHVAKTVLLRCPLGHYAVAVLPASDAVDVVRAADALGVDHVELATETELASICNDCAVGALPPFGSQYDMKTLVDQPLTNDEYVLFEGNNHCEAIRMKYGDFARLEKPIVAEFGVARAVH
jgi:Ala-tRNA(Pro) deacylase